MEDKQFELIEEQELFKCKKSLGWTGWWTDWIVDMNIYSGDELDEYLGQAGFSEVLCILKEGPDSVAGEIIAWLCVMAQK